MSSGRGRGYIGKSMSVNMAEAQSEGRLPASKAAKALGVTTEAIKTVLSPSEWHHASSWYNKVDVYDINPYLAIKEGKDLSDLGYSEKEIEEYKKDYDKMKKMPKPDKSVEQFYGNAEWIEWTGTRTRPKANVHKAENIKIEKKGQFYTFYLKDGTTVRKKEDSNGTYVYSEEELAKRKIADEFDKLKKERLKQIEKEYSKEYEEYQKSEHLDKPTQETFSKYRWSLNFAQDNVYITGQKPQSEFKEKGLRRIHINNRNNDLTEENYRWIILDGVLQEWNGEEWVDIEKVKNLKEGNDSGYDNLEYYLRNNNEEYRNLANAYGADAIEKALSGQETRLYQYDITKPSRIEKNNYISDLRKAEQTSGNTNQIIRLGDLPLVYRAIGIPTAKVNTNKKIIIKDTVQKHSVPMEIVENLPELYSNPVIVFSALDTSTNKNAYVAVLDAFDKDGKQMIAAISPAKDETGYHMITSFYGRNNINNMINKAFEENKVRYVRDKKNSLLTGHNAHLSQTNNSIIEKSDVVNIYFNPEIYQ